MDGRLPGLPGEMLALGAVSGCSLNARYEELMKTIVDHRVGGVGVVSGLDEVKLIKKRGGVS